MDFAMRMFWTHVISMGGIVLMVIAFFVFMLIIVLKDK
jgi:hypothetical protein